MAIMGGGHPQDSRQDRQDSTGQTGQAGQMAGQLKLSYPYPCNLNRSILLWAQLVGTGTVAAYSSPSCLCWGPYQIS